MPVLLDEPVVALIDAAEDTPPVAPNDAAHTDVLDADTLAAVVMIEDPAPVDEVLAALIEAR